MLGCCWPFTLIYAFIFILHLFRTGMDERPPFDTAFFLLFFLTFLDLILDFISFGIDLFLTSLLFIPYVLLSWESLDFFFFFYLKLLFIFDFFLLFTLFYCIFLFLCGYQTCIAFHVLRSNECTSRATCNYGLDLTSCYLSTYMHTFVAMPVSSIFKRLPMLQFIPTYYFLSGLVTEYTVRKRLMHSIDSVRTKNKYKV